MYARIQSIVPPVMTFNFRTTRNQRGNFIPIIATVRVHRILQLDVFACCPFTRTFSRPANAVSQGISTSVMTLLSRATRNQRGSCHPIFVLSCISSAGRSQGWMRFAALRRTVNAYDSGSRSV
jgi:hypothetical protein